MTLADSRTEKKIIFGTVVHRISSRAGEMHLEVRTLSGRMPCRFAGQIQLLVKEDCPR